MTSPEDIKVLDRVFNMDLLPKSHVNYLNEISKDIKPKIIYDIGSCVLHWTRHAKKTWSDSQIICFDAFDDVSKYYDDKFGKFDFHAYVLSDKDDEEKIFYKNLHHIGGQSLYQENSKFNIHADALFGKNNQVKIKTSKLDTIVERYNLPLPDLIKMDVQGSELDVIHGGMNTIQQCKDIILELQEVDYNKGAPKSQEAIQFMASLGYGLVKAKFSNNRFDADYHFRKL